MADTNSFWVDDEQHVEDGDILDLFSGPDGEALTQRLDKINEQSKKDPEPDTVVVEEEPDYSFMHQLDAPNRDEWVAQHPDFQPKPGEGVAYDPEQITVEEEPVSSKDTIPGSDSIFVEEDKDDDKPVEPKTWEKDKDHSQFISYVLDRKTKIPKHSGETIPGCERAKSYLKSLYNEMSGAMRTDYDACIDEQQVDSIRKEIDNMVERLDRQIDKLKKKTKKANLDVRLISEGQCEKCNCTTPMWHDIANNKLVCLHCEAEEDTITSEELNKTAGTARLVVYMSAFERAIVGTLIDSAVSGGRDIEETYERLKNKYNFTPQQELAIQQLVADSGYPMLKDCGLLNENSDPSSGNSVEWQTQYYA